MKKSMMLMGLMLVSTIIFAQHRGFHRDSTGTKHLEKMKTDLSLNDDQYARVKAINEKFTASRVKLRSDTSLTVGTMRNRMKKLETDKEVQFKGVLTETQWTKWTTARTKHQEDRKKHRHHGGDHKGKGEKG